MKKQKQTKIIHRPLGKERAWGIAHIGDNKIELDNSLSGYRHLLYLLHEHFHLKHPDWSETKVVKESRITARFLWNNNYRWADLK